MWQAGFNSLFSADVGNKSEEKKNGNSCWFLTSFHLCTGHTEWLSFWIVQFLMHKSRTCAHYVVKVLQMCPPPHDYLTRISYLYDTTTDVNRVCVIGLNNHEVIDDCFHNVHQSLASKIWRYPNHCRLIHCFRAVRGKRLWGFYEIQNRISWCDSNIFWKPYPKEHLQKQLKKSWVSSL